MTKEELEKEAEVFAEKHAFRVPYDGSNKFYDDVDFKASKEGYLASALPREKQITGLSKHILELQKDKGNLIDRVRELEQQIEKMKKYLDCDYCEYQNNKDECHQCNYLEKTRWTLKKEKKND